MRSPPDADRRPGQGADLNVARPETSLAGQATPVQPSFWEPPRIGFAGQDPPRVRNQDRPTSHEAARSLDRAALGRRCAELLALIADAGCRGLTTAELVEITGHDRGNSARRVTDLHQAGKVVDSGRTRPGASGRPGIVWVAPNACRGAA